MRMPAIPVGHLKHLPVAGYRFLTGLFNRSVFVLPFEVMLAYSAGAYEL